MNKQIFEFGIYKGYVDARLKKMEERNFPQRFWNKDESLWRKEKQPAVNLLMGWLDTPLRMLEAVPEIEAFSNTVRQSGITHFVLLGMGGSSMAPLVFKKLFSCEQFFILDTTNPEEIKNIENKISLPQTLFIVSSKSGTTIEVCSLFDYFFQRMSEIKKEKAGDNFIAITDEGTPLAELARKKNFRKTFINSSDIGGRFSALSYFGIIPAALMGINVRELLERTIKSTDEWASVIPVSQNSAFVMGAALAELAWRKCDKLTYLLPKNLEAFGIWLEQLLAESTGKKSKGILPLNGYPLADYDTYGKDRFFAHIDFLSSQSKTQWGKLENFIIKKYIPVIHTSLSDELDLGTEFFRWEIATTVAAAILNINPFDQPNVEESKKQTEKLLKRAEWEVKLPAMEPSFVENEIQYYTSGREENAKLMIEKFFATAEPGKNYIALLAYLPRQAEVEKYLSEIECALQENFHLPVTSQFGPSYLHSTGQYHKDGPNNGYFIEFIYSPHEELNIPGRNYSFNTLLKAQAIGDMKALMKHKRKIILVDIGKDFLSGLKSFKQIIERVTEETMVV